MELVGFEKEKREVGREYSRKDFWQDRMVRVSKGDLGGRGIKVTNRGDIFFILESAY